MTDPPAPAQGQRGTLWALMQRAKIQGWHPARVHVWLEVRASPPGPY